MSCQDFVAAFISSSLLLSVNAVCFGRLILLGNIIDKIPIIRMNRAIVKKARW